MHHISIDASPKQLSKLRRGLPVRVKQGEGFGLLVHPNNYHLASRAFGKNKGISIQLSPEEIQHNKNAVTPPEEQEGPIDETEEQPTIEGQGIFGHKFDRYLKRKGVKKMAYQIGDILKPGAKAAITAGLTAGATSLGAFQPQLIPYLPAGVAGASALAYDYLDNPTKYQGSQPKSGLTSRAVKDYAGQVAKSQAEKLINDHLGTNYGYMNQAGIGNLQQEQANQEMTSALYGARGGIPDIPQYSDEYGAPPSRGYGMTGGGFHHHRERGSIGRGASMVQAARSMPPALMSQPHGANFQMKHFLPPQYVTYFNPQLDYVHNGPIGLGLYAGRGLY